MKKMRELSVRDKEMIATGMAIVLWPGLILSIIFTVVHLSVLNRPERIILRVPAEPMQEAPVPLTL